MRKLFGCFLLLTSWCWGAENSLTVGYPMELSGLAALPEGVLLADDELLGSVLFVPRVQLQSSERLQPALAKLQRKKKDRKEAMEKYIAMEDIEGIAADSQGKVYLLASHDADRDETPPARRPNRELIVKAELKGGNKVKLEIEQVWDGLLAAVAPALAEKKIEVDLTDKSISPSLNFEGIAVAGKSLLLGLRAPLHEEHAIVVQVAFGGDCEKVYLLDLKGSGVRDLSMMQDGTVAILSEKESEEPEAAVWTWTPGQPPQPLYEFRNLMKGDAPEGLCFLGAKEMLVAVENEEQGTPYLLRVLLD